MPDTYRSNFNNPCTDCGCLPSTYYHHGALVPNGAEAYFCQHCFGVRSQRCNQGIQQLPLGRTIYEGLVFKITFPTPTKYSPALNAISRAFTNIDLDKLGISGNQWEVTLSAGQSPVLVDERLNQLRADFPEIAVIREG